MCIRDRAKESEMIGLGVGEDGSGSVSVSRCSRQDLLKCNRVRMRIVFVFAEYGM